MATIRDESLPLFGEQYEARKMRQLVNVIQRIIEFEDYSGERVRIVNAATDQAQGTDAILIVDYTDTGVVTINLPTAADFKGRSLTIFDRSDNASVNNITLAAAGSELILGASTYTINTDSKSIILTSDGTGWFIRAQS